MKNIKIFLAVCAAAFFSTAHAATMQFDDLGLGYSGVEGGTVDVVLQVSGLELNTFSGESLIGFDPGVLQVDTVTLDPAFTLSPPPAIDNVGGTIGLFGTFFPLSGDSNIATVTFSLVGLGTSPLSLSSPINPADPTSSFWFYTDGTGAVINYCVTHVDPAGVCENDNADPANALLLLTDSSVTVVPVPAAVWLFGAGLLGLVAVARRGKRTA